MADICEANIPHEQLEISGATQQCQATGIERTSLVRLLWAPAGSAGTPESAPNDYVAQFIAVTTTYRYCVFPEGFGIGKHLYSTTLLPGEEQELETFQSQKTETELKSSNSVETEFLEEFENVIQEETQKTEESNFSVSGGLNVGVNLGVVSIGAKGDIAHSTKEINFHKQATSDTHKTSDRTTRKNDLSMGTKTEVTSTTRSTRRVRNPNLCQSVTWSFFQLQRRVRVKLILESLTFDIFDKGALMTSTLIPQAFKGQQPTLRDFRIPRPTREEVLAQAQSDSLFSTAPYQGLAPSMSPSVINAAQERVGFALQFAVKKRDLDDLVARAEELAVFVPGFETSLGTFTGTPDVPTARQNFRAAVQARVIDPLTAAVDGALPPFVAVEEVLDIATNSMHAEATTSRCMGCDTHTALEQKLEREKLALERDKLRKEVLAGASIMGSVKSIEGTMSGVVIALTDRGQTPFVVIAQTVTDEAGNFSFGVAGIFPSSGRSLRLAVVPPFPERFDTPTPQQVDFTFDGRQVEIHFFMN
jgi:hypothetical protein